MEYYEYLRKSGFVVDSSAKDLKKIAESLRMDPAHPRPSLEKVKWKIEVDGGTATNWDAARSWIEHNKEKVKADMKLALDETNVNAMADLIDQIAAEKSATKKRIHNEKAIAATVNADYTVMGLSKSKDNVEIFNCVPVIAPNKHDRKLMSCFAILGNAVVFKANGHCYRLMTKTSNGKPQIVFAAGDSGAEGVMNEITSALALNFELYMRRTISRIAELEEYPDDDESQHPIEDVFLNEVPTIFRHIVDIRKTFKADSEDGRIKYFQNYRVYAKKSAVNELTVSAFVEWLASNWIRASRDILERSAKYLVFSNEPDELAVHHFCIWPEAQWRKATIPESWDNIFGAKASQRLLNRLYFFTGSLLDARNCAQQYLAISDPGQTGKGLYVEILTAVLGNLMGTNMIVHLDNSVFKDENQFGLSSLQVWNYRIGVVDEYDGRSLNTNKSKAIIGGDRRNLDMKFADSVDWDTKQFRLIAPSNNGFVLKQHSLRRRCIPITFKATHSSKDNLNDDDKKVLIEDGEKFLMYCWRVYQESPLRQRDGGYFVCCPEDEELYLSGKWEVESDEVNPKTGEHLLKPVHDDKMRYLRAFSKDPEISAYYTVDDYEDSEITEGFNQFVDRYCDISEDDESYMRVCDFMDLVVEYSAQDRKLFETFGDALKTKNKETVFDFRSGDYKIFKKYMENHGHPAVHTKDGNAFKYITIKDEYFDKKNGVVLRRDPTSSDGVFRAKSAFKAEDNSFLNQDPEVDDEDR